MKEKVREEDIELLSVSEMVQEMQSTYFEVQKIAKENGLGLSEAYQYYYNSIKNGDK